MKTCRELVKNHSLANDVDLTRYSSCNANARQLIQRWFHRAWEQRDCEPVSSFEPFIYTWFALNGWAFCVTGHDSDSDWRQALSITPELCSNFSDFINDTHLVNDTYTPGSQLARKFSSLWPIFDARDIRRKNAQIWEQVTREEAVRHYLQAGINKFDPDCWLRHTRANQNAPLERANENVPLDWPHVLASLYKVRCNLFHGGKGTESEMDVKIVHSAFRLLVYFLGTTQYFGDSAGGNAASLLND